MNGNYFYGQQAEQFAFYRIPKILFSEERYKHISSDAKLLYGILLDRMGLSIRNGWLDDEDRVFIYFTIEEICEELHCANKKAVGLMNELEHKAGLIERKRQGLGKPSRLYLKNFVDNSAEVSKAQFKKCENDTSRDVKSTLQEVSKLQSNNTDINKTDMNKINPILSGGSEGNGAEPTYQSYLEYFEDTLEVKALKIDYPYEATLIDNIVELIAEVMCSKRKTIRIASDDKPINLVKSRFMKLNSEHIRFVLDGFQENTTRVRNVKQYLLAAIFNAPTTIDGYYSALVRHDMANG